MQSRLQDCIERNGRRTGQEKIKNNAIAATSNKLELPNYDEGFDSLYFVSFENGRTEIQEWRTEEE